MKGKKGKKPRKEKRKKKEKEKNPIPEAILECRIVLLLR